MNDQDRGNMEDVGQDPSQAGPKPGASLAIQPHQDDPEVRRKYRPFLASEGDTSDDWVADLDLNTAMEMVVGQERPRILVLYGSVRRRSYSRLLAYEASRILFRLGCDVRVYDPAGLPQKDELQHAHPKVQELRNLSKWSNGHLWISPEQHGNLTSVFKQQIDWIPLSSGATNGRTLAVAQVNGMAQSFNAVNSLRILGRWMRMFAIPSQIAVPEADTKFGPAEEGSRMLPGAARDALVDCMEELVKYTIVIRPHFDLFQDKFSSRKAKLDG